MWLGEALALRADLKKRGGEVMGRITSNARYQEGAQPGFEVAALVAEYGRLADELCAIIQRINRTNTLTPFDGRTLADALIERDRLGMMHVMQASLVKASSETVHHHLRSELRTVAQVRASEAQAVADGYAKARRELDVRIQAANWATTLQD
ncbi:MAG: DIP1984 family protein [Luteimonas sp.]|nr:DIP1984 family protein [Luteimonas sp.]